MKNYKNLIPKEYLSGHDELINTKSGIIKPYKLIFCKLADRYLTVLAKCASFSNSYNIIHVNLRLNTAKKSDTHESTKQWFHPIS